MCIRDSDHAGLDPLAEEDDEGGNHRGAVVRSRIAQILGKPKSGCVSILFPRAGSIPSTDRHGPSAGRHPTDRPTDPQPTWCSVLWSVWGKGSANSFILSIVVSRYDQVPSATVMV